MDVRDKLPAGDVDLVLCRNVVFTYVDREGQRGFLERLRPRLRPGAWLVIGKDEHIPEVDFLEDIGGCVFALRNQ